MPATLEQAIEIVNSLQYQDRVKLRKWLDKQIKQESETQEENISEQSIEILRKFYDDFYNENKSGFSQQELKNAVAWVLTKYD